MILEERLEQAEKLVAEVKAELAAMRATKARNWPERIEAGMVFRARSGYEKEGDLFVAAEDEEPYLLHAATGRFYNRGKYFWDEFPWERYEYLGMAANGLVWSDPTQACENAADAHEPTGAELVGRVCEFSDDGENWTDGARPREQGDPRICIGYDGKSDRPYSNRWAEWKLARLAK